MKSAYTYTVTVDNINNDEEVAIYEGDDLAVAEAAYDDYKFAEGDQRKQLCRYELSYQYEGQVAPDYNPTPTTLKERYHFK